jgi:hypothetical protein
MGLADLTDSGHLDGVVELAVASLGEAMHGPSARGELDGGRAVVGRIMISAAETANVAPIADGHAGDDGTDPEQLHERRIGGPHGVADAAMGVLELGVEDADVCEQLEGQVTADLLHSRVRDDPSQEPLDVRSVEFLGDSARKVERYNRTLLNEWAYARPYRSEAARTRALDKWLHMYNHQRHHTAIGCPPINRVNNLVGQDT